MVGGTATVQGDDGVSFELPYRSSEYRTAYSNLIVFDSAIMSAEEQTRADHRRAHSRCSGLTSVRGILYDTVLNRVDSGRSIQTVDVCGGYHRGRLGNDGHRDIRGICLRWDSHPPNLVAERNFFNSVA